MMFTWFPSDTLPVESHKDPYSGVSIITIKPIRIPVMVSFQMRCFCKIRTYFCFASFVLICVLY